MNTAQSPDPHAAAQPSGSGYRPTQKSVTAVTSMVLGIMSPVVLCTCLPSIVTSGLAVITGHLALGKIRRSRGRLIGRGSAYIGLVLGYTVLAISLYMLPTFFSGLAEIRTNVQSGEIELGAALNSPMQNAERLIGSDSEGTEHGNSPQAIELARRYSEVMTTLRDAAFERNGKNRFSATNDQFVTYCQLSERKCCFLVHVPEYRRFSDSAKDTLSDLSWTAAQLVVGELKNRELDNHQLGRIELDDGDQLGVGLKGNFIYGSVLTGVVVSDRDDEDLTAGLTRSGSDSSVLRVFFDVLEDKDE